MTREAAAGTTEPGYQNIPISQLNNFALYPPSLVFCPLELLSPLTGVARLWELKMDAGGGPSHEDTPLPSCPLGCAHFEEVIFVSLQ